MSAELAWGKEDAMGNLVRGELRYEEPMARHTSWRVGGPAQCFYRPADMGDLSHFLRFLPTQETLLWLGLGSNLLVRDGGIRGIVIATHGRLNSIELLDEMRVRAEAGVSCAKVARFSAQASLRGGEFLAGIPGTIGGALAMNAGAFGGETWELLEAVETIDRNGKVRLRGRTDFDIAYRQVRGPADEWFGAVHLRLKPGNGSAGKKLIRDLLRRRSDRQPIQMPSGGSVFKNPPGDFAGRLVEISGLKGTCIGGARVADKHANFIVNTGQASAHDIEALINHIQRTVQHMHGVHLVPEVHIVGDP